MLKSYLDEHNISYTEKLVDDDDEARKEMMAHSDGFLGVPFTVITKDDGTTKTVIGFDKNRINGILGLA